MKAENSLRLQEQDTIWALGFQTQRKARQGSEPGDKAPSGAVLRVQEGPTHTGGAHGARAAQRTLEQTAGPCLSPPAQDVTPGRQNLGRPARDTNPPRDTKKERRPQIRTPAASRPGRARRQHPHGLLHILEGTRMPHTLT